jgi:hypothetical protein
MNMGKYDIQQLVDDLEPVAALRPARSMITSVLITAAFMALVLMLLGPRDDLMAGKPDGMFLLRGGILLLLGFANAYAVLAMASPSVGRQGKGWQVALAAALLFPLAALIVGMSDGQSDATDAMRTGMQCLRMSVIGGLAVAIPMVLHLRRGAPTSAERAGWLTGLAAGGFGAFAYGFHCPFNSIVYIGLWYSLAVGVCAVLGRLIVPRLIRW